MQKYFEEAKQLLILAIPVILSQISQTAMGFVDTTMAGAVSATDMAAVAVGTSIWLPVILFALGILMAITPTVAHLAGSGRRDKVGNHVQQGLWLAALLSVFVIAVIWNAGIFIRAMSGIDPKMADIAERYLHALMWGAPGFLFFQVIRDQCDGLSKTKPSMVVGFIGLLCNIPINYIFIYGHFGMPALGGVGCGVATASVYWLMFIVLWAWTKKTRSLRDIRPTERWAKPNLKVISRIVTLGLPIASALFFEVTLFAVVAILVSPLGIVDVAGHQIALNFSSLMFVIPLSMGIASTIRVGYQLGRGSPQGAKVAAWTSQAVGLCFVCCTAIATVVFRHDIARLYNHDPAVVTLAGQLMLLAAIYQCSDSVQVIGSGILRGYKDTRAIFFITFVSYWLLGLPSGYLLGLTDLIVPRMGPAGFWCGFIIGLTTAAILMVLRIIALQKKPADVILRRASH
ncbi:MATE family efflux transporter [Rosenbergiella epipactidis]|uniref:MATE family efflux transporter n=1 Tax=Rosenbergiella epipactidis TaxID=1544694 RepID=UPI001F4EE663|nr:MATE family efflux transporter [Rosenbergiella epipactidis]